MRPLRDRWRGALDNKLAWLTCVALVFALQVTLILRHVPWLDEWQALLIVEQSPSLGGLFENLRYEGHPPLWYGLLAVLAKVVPFAHVLTAASLLIAFSTQALIQFLAPFSRLERLLLGLGEIASFEFGTIARGFALGALLMLAVASLWRSRWVWLAIAFLPLSEFIFGVVALILVILSWRERRPPTSGLALFVGASALAAWSVWPAADLAPAANPSWWFIEVTDFVQRLGGLIVPFQMFDGRIAWDGFLPLGTGGLFGGLFLLWMAQRYADNRAFAAAVFGLIALCFVMSLAIYQLHFRHLTVIGWLVVVLTWIRPPAALREATRWRAWLIIGAICGIATAAVELTRPFDAAPQVAATISRLDDGRHPWLVSPATRVPPLAALTRRSFHVPSRGCDVTFVRWNHANEPITARPLRAAMTQWAERYGESYLILEQYPLDIPASVFKPLTKTIRGYDGQHYVIGVLGPGRPIKPLSARPCVADAKPLR